MSTGKDKSARYTKKLDELAKWRGLLRACSIPELYDLIEAAETLLSEKRR
jgi:hypothetical protein